MKKKNQLKDEIVPFSEASLGAHDMKLLNPVAYELPKGRRVEIWKIEGEDGSLCIRIFRQTLDGKTSKLVFGLSEDACYALALLLVNNNLISPYRGRKKEF